MRNFEAGKISIEESFVIKAKVQLSTSAQGVRYQLDTFSIYLVITVITLSISLKI